MIGAQPMIAKETTEQRMLATLAPKRGLADGILDRIGDLMPNIDSGQGKTWPHRIFQSKWPVWIHP